jgi:dTDP-4-amino-4,6-dideoxygalactose transaminase
MDENPIGIFGGSPVSPEPLNIVRPRFPSLARIADRFSDSLESGQVTNNGRWVVEFERSLTDYVGVPTIAFNNGQSALMTMLHAADVAGGEVIIPSYTFCATPHAVCWAGAQPVFADIKADGSMCIDPEDVERKITGRTRAILSVDTYGIVSDYEALREIGNRHGLKVLGDSAPAFGTKVEGRPIGDNCDAHIFSFHASKAFATMEGGCLCSGDGEMIERAKALRNFGQVAGGDCDEAGHNAKMMEICALIGFEQLKEFDGVVQHRAQMAERMRAGLQMLPGLEFAIPPEGQLPVWLYFPVCRLSRSGLSRVQRHDEGGVRHHNRCGHADSLRC